MELYKQGNTILSKTCCSVCSLCNDKIENIEMCPEGNEYCDTDCLYFDEDYEFADLDDALEAYSVKFTDEEKDSIREAIDEGASVSGAILNAIYNRAD